MKVRKLLFGILILTLGTSLQTQAQDPFTNGLVAYYPFNGNANDESGNGHHAVVMTTGIDLTNGVNGAPNSAYRFEPSGEQFMQGSGINLSNSSMSITLWFKKDYTNYTLQHGGLVRLGKIAGGGETGRSLHIYVMFQAPLRFSFFYDDFDVAVPVGNGNWSHIACTFDKVTMERRIYVDGSLIATNIAVRGFSGPTDFDFHAAGNGGAGLIDQVRFYNRVLSSNEVTNLYVYESPLVLNLRKAVYLDSPNLQIGTNYQVQVSTDLNTWTNYGAAFTATNSAWRSTNYWDVGNWDELFFRLQVAP